MSTALFNVNNGYSEALCRGLTAALIKGAQYANMTQCESLEDLRLQLASTDYAATLANVPSPLTTKDFHTRLFRKIVADFRYLQTTATQPLARFLEFITYGYMIDNVVLMISGTLHHRDKADLLARCHPLGYFDTLPALSVSTDIEQLYDVVLIDTPLAPYFKDCFQHAEELSDVQIEIVRQKLYNAYLQDFYDFCQSLPAPTNEVMGELLRFEADRRAVNVSLNSYGAGLSREERERLMPTLGNLYPFVTSQLVRAEDPEQVRAVLESSALPELQNIFDASNGQSIESHFYRQEIDLCRFALTQQFCYATYYAWLKCAEQEVRNVSWIAECIAQNQRERINNFVSLA